MACCVSVNASAATKAGRAKRIDKGKGRGKSKGKVSGKDTGKGKSRGNGTCSGPLDEFKMPSTLFGVNSEVVYF